ncbi:hypothetical protein GCM10011571_32600 [Marinithermofilum abyssi]|uniref:Glutaredoxin n=1 Tax=Marinithermofilum abyssi TaxID=1571185 RepID=A0A8J2VJU7_9BACL|nr:hypothetical protein [Marinithermofilum abyssi]GGE27919.1 hypothetical protein GCM10011571_32600 [Marinithermofilum abyssi]
MNNQQVTLLTHPGCFGGRRARNYLKNQRIPFEEIHWSEIPSEFRNKLNSLVVVSPTILVGNRVLRGFDSDQFQQVYHQQVKDE